MPGGVVARNPGSETQSGGTSRSGLWLHHPPRGSCNYREGGEKAENVFFGGELLELRLSGEKGGNTHL